MDSVVLEQLALTILGQAVLGPEAAPLVPLEGVSSFTALEMLAGLGATSSGAICFDVADARPVAVPSANPAPVTVTVTVPAETKRSVSSSRKEKAVSYCRSISALGSGCQATHPESGHHSQ